MNDTEQIFKYYAFISYSSKDTEWGKKIQRKLENYRLPATICNEHGWKRTPIKPVFFAPTDIQPGGLTAELQERLKSSRNLIVICSPNSAKSDWVGREIEYFNQLGRTEHIHYFIVEGTPHSNDSETECFNPVITKLGLPEILGANIHEKNYRWPWLNKERAYVQLISKLLGVEFDTIWQRHKRLVIQKVISWIIFFFVVSAALIGVRMTSQPIDIEMKLREASAYNKELPPLTEAVITLTLDNEQKSDTLYSIDEFAKFTNIPRHFLNKNVHISVNCLDYINLDTTLLLTKENILNIYRDPTVYGNILFRLKVQGKDKFIPNSKLIIDGHEIITDKDGYASLSIPLEQQKTAYKIISTIPLERDTIYTPCGEGVCVIVKTPY